MNDLDKRDNIPTIDAIQAAYEEIGELEQTKQHIDTPRLSRYEASPTNTFSRYEPSQPALRRLVSMPTLAVSSLFSKLKAMCLKIAKFSAPLPFRILDSSSRKAISNRK